MSDVFFEALQDYLRGREWKQSIEMFVEANCHEFRRCREFDHKHHALWKTFQEIVEQILDMALSNVGGSISMLEDAFDKISTTPSKGPRDEVVKELIAKLQTYESFEEFSLMMTEAAANLQDGDGPSDNSNSNAGQFVDTLVTMGFPEDLVLDVVSQHRGYTTLEQLVIQLSEIQYQPPVTPVKRPQESKQTRSTPVASSPQSRSVSSGPSSHFEELANLINRKDPTATSIDASDLNTKFVMAVSVLESIDGSDNLEGAEKLVNWAKSMNDLLNSIVFAHSNRIPLDQTMSDGKNILERFEELERIRRSLDDTSVLGHLISDRELERMAELDRIAALGTEDEQLLHRLIVRNDEIRKDIAMSYRKLGDISRPGSDVDREKLEELYLYLKEKVGSRIDLESIADELHEQVYAVVSSSMGAEVVNLLLELHILEDEQTMVRQKIQGMLQTSPNRAKSVGEDLDVLTGDNIVLVAEDKDSFYGDEAKAVGSSIHHSEQISFSPNYSDSKHGSTDSYGHSKEFDTDGKSAGSVHQVEAPINFSQPKSTTTNQSRLEEDNSEYVDSLKSKHKESLEKLKLSLDQEKNKRLQELEARLARRKAINKRELASNPSMSAEGKNALDEELSSLTSEVDKETRQLNAKFDKLTQGLVSGFKKRCVAELKAVRANNNRPLLPEELDNCFRDAADALKKRHERDQKSLLDSLEAERSRQRAKILQRLENNKKKILSSGDGGNGNGEMMRSLDEEAIASIMQMNDEFRQQENEAVENSQRDVLLALSVLEIDNALLLQASPADEDDESYLDDRNPALNSWIENVDRVQEAYLTAGKLFNDKLRGAVEASTPLSLDPDVDDTYTEIAAISNHMSKVVTEAFCSQVKELDANSVSRRSSSEQSVDLNRIRAGIMNEFERARSDYESTLENARKTSQARLDKRKATEAKPRVGDREDKPTLKAHLYVEDVIDSFLDDPVQPARNVSSDPRRGKAISSASQPKLKPLTSNRTHNSAVPSTLSAALPSTLAAAPPTTLPAAFPSSLPGLTVPTSSTDENEMANKDRIRADHERTERMLMEQLQVQMRNKKAQLEERLKRRNERAIRSESKGDSDNDNDSDKATEDVVVLENDLKHLESAFDQIREMLKGSSSSIVADKTNIANVMEMLEKMTKGHHIDASPSYAAVDQTTPHDDPLEFARAFGEDTPGMSTKTIDKESLQEKVKKISSEYNEEKQKLDLMMKIQQTRQRQILQRKLMERKQQTGFTIPEAALNATKVNTGIASRGLNLGPMMRK